MMNGSVKSELNTLLQTAYARHVIIPAFNVAYLPMVKPLVDTFKRLRCFGLLEVALPDITHFGAESFAAVATEFRRHGDRRHARLHQDHVPVIDADGNRVGWQALIQEAIDLKYDSVMIDGSRLPFDENVAVTRSVVNMAHAKGIAVEAELGAVLGHEKGPLPPYEELFISKRGFTAVGDAIRFVRETGVDWLSVAVGNIHGAISGTAKDKTKLEARIDTAHLQAISQAVRIPLVLHGGTGIRRDCVLESAHHGITKINIGTQIRQPYEKALAQTQSVSAAQAAVAQETENLITNYFNLVGSLDRIGCQ